MASRNQRKLGLAAVISKVRKTADVQYDGKVYENIMPIFNQLSTSEKRVLLRGLIGICFTIEEKVSAAPAEAPEEGDEEEDRREETRGKMKPWIVKLVGAVLFVALLAVSASSFFLTGENGLIMRTVRFIEVVKKGVVG